MNNDSYDQTQNYKIGVILDLDTRYIEWFYGGVSGTPIQGARYDNISPYGWRPAVSFLKGSLTISRVTTMEGPEQFSIESKGPQIKLIDGNMSVSSMNDIFAWNTVYGSKMVRQGLHVWKIRITRYVAMAQGNKWWCIVGVAKSFNNAVSYFTNHGGGYGYILQGQKTESNGSSEYGRAVKDGDELFVILDLSNRTLRFRLNNENLGTSHTKLPKTAYRLAISIGHCDTELRLIGHKENTSMAGEFFDPYRHGPQVTVGQEGNEAIFSGNIWNTVQGPLVIKPNTGIFSWQVRLNTLTTSLGVQSNSFAIALGLQPAQAPYGVTGNCIGHSDQLGGWALILGTGQKATGGQRSGYTYPFSVGEIVGISYNSDTGELRFSRDGTFI